MSSRKYFESLRQQLDQDLKQRNEKIQTQAGKQVDAGQPPIFTISKQGADEPQQHAQSAKFLDAQDSRERILNKHMPQMKEDLNDNKTKVHQ